MLGFKLKKGDATAAFIHVDIGEGENVYINTLKGFDQYSKSGRKKCLNLKKMLYGLCQSPHACFQYSTKKLEARGLKQS